jgi:hypothetical protein
VSLYTSVYWTKRAFIVFALIIFLCSGFRVFTFVSDKFSTNKVTVSEPKPELGFDLLDKLTLTPLDLPPGFRPADFKNLTNTGTFDVDNGYPTQDVKAPIANVYKIAERKIDLNTTEVPRKIAKNLNFSEDPTQEISTAIKVWKDRNRELEINGQYSTLKYKNTGVRQTTMAAGTKSLLPGQSNVVSNAETDKTRFDSVLKEIGLPFENLATYKFESTAVNFDASKNDFVLAGAESAGSFVRINATRLYPSLSKVSTKANTTAVYPNYLYSNNYIILPATAETTGKLSDKIVELSFYNWPIELDTKSKNVQTYPIKTPRKAFEELKTTNKYLMSAAEWDTKIPVSADKLIGIDEVMVRRIRLEMYEDILYTNTIQPISVFVTEADLNGKRYQLIYYIPAVTYVV